MAGHKRAFLSVLTVVLSGYWAVDALAQTSSGSDDQLMEIIVTAQKRDQSLERVPLSIDVVGGTTLEQRQIDTVSDLSRVVPGFEFDRAPNEIPSLTFRGLGPQSGNVAFDNSIGMFVDGIFLGNVRLYNQTLFDVDHVELIKGTQSSLLGKNTTIGALSIGDVAPSNEFGGRIEAGREFQDRGEYFDGAINLPLSDQIDMRVAARYSDNNGWIRNLRTDLLGPWTIDEGARVSLKYAPTDKFSVLIRYQYTENQTIGSADVVVAPGLAIPGVPGAPFTTGAALYGPLGGDVRESYNPSPGLHYGDDFLSEKLHIGSVTANYDFGPVSLTSITAGAWSRNISNIDFDFDNKDDNARLRDERYSQFTQEFRVTSNDTSAFFQYIGGFFFVHSTLHIAEDDIWGIPDYPPDPTSPLYGQLFNGSFSSQFDQSDVTYSPFAQLTFLTSEKGTVNLGGRYTHDEKIVEWGRTPDLSNLTLWNTVIQAPFPYQELKPVTDNLLSGSVSYQYQFDPTTMAYGSVSRGGKAGGYGEFAGVPADPSLPLHNGLPQGNPNVSGYVKPERATAYELGVKSSLFDNSVTTNSAVFWTDLYNLQQLAFTGQFVVTNNRVRDKGIEESIDFKPLAGLTVSLSGVYAYVKDLQSGLDIAESPRLSGSGRVAYAMNLGPAYTLTVAPSVRYRSGKYNQLGQGDYDPAFRTAAFTARLENTKAWWVNLDIENAFNARGADFGFPSADPFVAEVITLAPLRTITLSAGTKF
jgi:iron complex outermembrane receptor protein